MSSSATLKWDEGEGLTADEWTEFRALNRITHSPSTVGGNVFYAGKVEIHFGEADYDSTEPPETAEEISLGTYHHGEAMPDVARLTRELWLAHGGSLTADPEIRRLIVHDEELPALKAELRRWALSAHESAEPSTPEKEPLKVFATIEFPGTVYLIHEGVFERPVEIPPRTPWVRGMVPGGELMLDDVPLGTVERLQPESEACYEDGRVWPVAWITHRTQVGLTLNLGALISDPAIRRAVS